MKGTFLLEKLTFEELPNVTHIWHQQDKQTLEEQPNATHELSQQDKQKSSHFQNLQQVNIKFCRKLKALFPVAIATNLKMLEQLEVSWCDGLLEIVEKDRRAGGGTKKFVFPYLTKMDLNNLPQLTHFYDGKFTLECPELNHLYPFVCNKFELFHTPSIIRPALFSNLKDISKVELMSMRSKDTSVLKSWLQESENLELEYLKGLMFDFFDDVNGEYSTLPFEILRRTPKLERMGMINSTSHKEISFLSQTPCRGKDKFLGHLEYLVLLSLFGLRSIGGLESLSKLQDLNVWHCPLLRTINQYPPNLKQLNVEGCHGLQYLFTSSAAKTLKHLEELNVNDCKSLKDIVQKEQNEETATEEIIFERLRSISLQCLESLECFYTGNAALKLPSLGRAKIWRCPKMTIFSPQLRDEDPPRQINVYFNQDDELAFPLTHPDVNVALGMQVEVQTYLVLSDYPEIQGKWVGSPGIPVEWSFDYLKYLEVEGCDFLTNAVLPSHLLPLLSNLENLTVKKCKHVKAIFDVKDRSPEHDDPNKNVTIPLREIYLEDLPTLTDVWNNDPKASLNFPSLEKVFVWECKSMKSLFPASVPKGNLQQLDLRKCEELEEIVAKDEAFAQDANNKEVIFQFPKLTYLALRSLPKLSCICSGMNILLDCSDVLTRLYVYRCPKLKVVAADIQNLNPGDDDKLGFVSSAQKAITSNFEELELSKEDVTMIEKGLLHVDLQNLNYLGLNNFNDNESDEFPDAFLSKMSLPKLKEFQMADCAFKDIFRSKGSDIDYSKMLSQLNILEITNLHKLNSIGFEQPWMAPLLENLETLSIWECNSLTNLAASPDVSFFNLTELSVENCAGLKYLFTSSTAKSLGALKKLSITKCKSLKTIVVHEESDKPEDMVLFSNLGALSLDELPQLESFYAGNSTLYFPGLHCIPFTITRCNKMKTFSHGEVLPKFMQGKIDEETWYGDLNTAVQKQFEKASIITTTAPMTYMDLLPTERSLLLLSFVMLGQSANGTLKKKQRITLELPCPPEYNENTSG
ncbi:hypothetical protein PIB30_059510 [Stylosanthes scabra]|uniref:Disease resistance protein At4g27190-like leucine-rich repeats domain-containing protein n=1 Tax=Stylosanthes scabra TaxID=79078 RepID=A0ABU6YJM0_9FABA|nr:hypothetical protein [Stylosanthes scabra]